MNLSTLLAEPLPIPQHAIIAILALIVGGGQFLCPKGTKAHRILGYIWVVMMAFIAISGFFIHTLRLWGLFSPIHILSVITLVSLYLAIKAVRGGDIKRHKRIMQSLYFFALIVAGAFTLMPGRVMHLVIFGGG